MTPSAWLLLANLAVLAISLFCLHRARQRMAAIGTSWITRCSWLNEEQDALTLELGKEIFRVEDFQFVLRSTPRRFAEAFNDERTLLALEWMRKVRGRMRKLLKEHRRTIRARRDVTTASELRLAMEFLGFELASGSLSFLILVRGSSGAASVVNWYLRSATRLRGIIQQVAPSAASSLNGIVKTNS